MSRRIDRRAGRAFRRTRRAGSPLPALSASASRLTDALRAFGASADDVRRTLLQIFTAPPPRSRPLIHNGRKYHR